LESNTPQAEAEWKAALAEVQKQNEALAWADYVETLQLLMATVGAHLKELPIEVQHRHAAVLEASAKHVTVSAGDPL
jgi:hypothetical protein